MSAIQFLVVVGFRGDEVFFAMGGNPFVVVANTSRSGLVMKQEDAASPIYTKYSAR